MTVLVTGGTGFLGRALVQRLVASGEERIRVLVRPWRDVPWLEALRREAPDRVEPFAGDLDSLDAAATALAGVRTVHHLAAAKSGAAAEVFAGTLGTSRHLLDAMLAMGTRPRVVLASSFGVQGTAELPPGTRVDETTPLEPHPARRDAYSHAKLEQERMFRDAHARRGLPLTVLRPGVVYGPGQAAPSQRIGFGPRAGLFFLFGGRNRLPLTHVDNCAEAFRFAAAHARFDGDTYDIVDEAPPACRDYLRRYRAAHGGFLIVPVPWFATLAAAHANQALHRLSRDRVPKLLTPYRARTAWLPRTYSGDALRALGYRQPINTTEALDDALRTRPSSDSGG